MRFSNEVIKRVRKARMRGTTYRTLAEKFNMTIQHAWYICHNKSRIDPRMKPITRAPLNVEYCLEQYHAGKSFSQISFLEAANERRRKPYHKSTVENAIKRELGLKGN